MPKVNLIILVTIIAWTGFESSPAATAAQFSAMTATTHLRGVVSEARSRSVSGRESIALAKKCTLKRYRRPH